MNYKNTLTGLLNSIRILSQLPEGGTKTAYITEFFTKTVHETGIPAHLVSFGDDPDDDDQQIKSFSCAIPERDFSGQGCYLTIRVAISSEENGSSKHKLTVITDLDE